MRGLLSLPLMFFALTVFLAVSPVSAVEIVTVDGNGLTIGPSSSANVKVDVAYKLIIWFSDSDNETVSVSGYMPTNLYADFDPINHELTSLSGIEFTGGPFVLSTVDLSFFGGAATATGTGIGGEFDTPSVPGTVSGSPPSYSFDLAQHEAILNQGVFNVVSTVPGVETQTINVGDAPESAPLIGTGSITIGSPVINGSTATYDVDLEIPLDYYRNVETNDENLTVEVTVAGTYYASGTISRDFYIPPEVTLGLVDNGCPEDGLRSYTLTATGPGITTLSEFTIDSEVHQVFDGGTPSEWLGDGSASASETTDSYVIFGDMRFPDLGGVTWPGPGDPPDKVTEETIIGGGDSGMGTLSNYDDTVTAIYDSYTKNGEPGGEDTVELMQLVIENGGGLSIHDLHLLTSVEYDPNTGWSIIDEHNLALTLPSSGGLGDANRDGYIDSTDVEILAQHWRQTSDVGWAEGDFNGDGIVDDIDATLLAANWNPQSASVPEPSTLVLLAGMLLVVGLLRRK